MWHTCTNVTRPVMMWLASQPRAIGYATSPYREENPLYRDPPTPTPRRSMVQIFQKLAHFFQVTRVNELW